MNLFGYPTRTRLAIVLGAYHVLVGLVGLVTTIEYSPRIIERFGPQVRIQMTLLFGLIAAVFSLLILAGELLLRRRRHGLALASILQLAQIPLWSWGASSYQFLGGFYFAVLWSSHGARTIAGWKASLQFGWAQHITEEFIAINVVPLLILVALCRLLLSAEAPHIATSDVISVSR